MTSSLPQELGRRLAAMGAAPRLLLCTDFDGTLAPIAPRPEQARLLPGAATLLQGLAALAGTQVAVISGRARDDLRARSGLAAPVLLVGSHGAEMPGQPTGPDAAERQLALDRMEAVLAQICSNAAGAWCERKPFGLAVHIRQAGAAEGSRVLGDVRAAAAHWPGVQATEGKAVLELSLSRRGKGDAVRILRAGCGGDPAVIYLGDDVTDEAAFGALGDGDLGIKVGEGPTIAAHRLASEHEALAALTVLWQQRRMLRAGG